MADRFDLAAQEANFILEEQEDAVAGLLRSEAARVLQEVLDRLKAKGGTAESHVKYMLFLLSEGRL